MIVPPDGFAMLGLPMTTLSTGHFEEIQLAERCLDRDEQALTLLRSNYIAPVREKLLGRGATPTEAEELVESLLADCVMGAEGSTPLLTKYGGKASLHAWLFRVALNRFLDQKRRGKFVVDVNRNQQNPGDTTFFNRVPDASSARKDLDAVSEILHATLQEAFTSLPAESLLMLRLVYLHELSQREVGAMWGWHESKVSRTMSAALKDVREHVLSELRKRDNLELQWEDFVELCRTSSLEF